MDQDQDVFIRGGKAASEREAFEFPLKRRERERERAHDFLSKENLGERRGARGRKEEEEEEALRQAAQ